jgi:hypothetical protein
MITAIRLEFLKLRTTGCSRECSPSAAASPSW